MPRTQIADWFYRGVLRLLPADFRDEFAEDMAEVFRELKRYEIAKDQRLKREKAEEDRRAQAALDEISLVQHERGSGI